MKWKRYKAKLRSSLCLKNKGEDMRSFGEIRPSNPKFGGRTLSINQAVVSVVPVGDMHFENLFVLSSGTD